MPWTTSWHCWFLAKIFLVLASLQDQFVESSILIQIKVTNWDKQKMAVLSTLTEQISDDENVVWTCDAMKIQKEFEELVKKGQTKWQHVGWDCIDGTETDCLIVFYFARNSGYDSSADLAKICTRARKQLFLIADDDYYYSR